MFVFTPSGEIIDDSINDDAYTGCSDAWREMKRRGIRAGIDAISKMADVNY